MFFMGCKIYGTPKDIQQTAIHRLTRFFAQRMIESLRIFIAQITNPPDFQISQIFRNRFPDAWDFL